MQRSAILLICVAFVTVQYNCQISTAERITGGTFETVKVYNSVEEIAVEEKK